MTVRELIEKLQAAPPEARVLFDTEAARFHVHCVSVDECFYEPRSCLDAVVLHTNDPREH